MPEAGDKDSKEAEAKPAEKAEAPKGENKASDKKEEDGKKKWGWGSWQRDVEILKVAVTFYAACIGTFVTFQFNERQHELARIEAIAKMLPNLAVDAPSGLDEPKASPPSTSAGSAPQAPSASGGGGGSGSGKGGRLTRDGAIWAIFRTANNKTMLRDLAALFPEDIYRVVSSIAAAGELHDDPEAVTAMQVASEKLANRFAAANKTEMAARLYEQALRLNQRLQGKTSASFTIVDISEEDVEEPPTPDHITSMLVSLNKLGDMHRKEAETKKVSTGRWTARQMYKRVRTLGAKIDTKEGKLEVAKADVALASLYLKDRRIDTAVFYLKEAQKLNVEALGQDSEPVGLIDKQLADLLKLKEGGSPEVEELEARGDKILQEHHALSHPKETSKL